MKADPIGVATGNHYIDGDHACGEGAIAAGCRFLAGYPITPSTEVAERIAERFPKVGGMFIQMEDEIASMAAIIGAAWAGPKSMTVTSGPGFSLMMENIGLAVMLETPCVIVNVQRGGPSTGLPTLTAQSDMMQARWGSHGDYEIIALSPNSPQECFDLTITAFNLAETWRVPVMFMMDECVGHMTEKVIIPEADQIDIVPRKYYKGKKEDYRPFNFNGNGEIAPMIKAGEGYNIHLTGLTHDERGYPSLDSESQDKNVKHLVDKIIKNEEKIRLLEEDQINGAEVIVISYGITSRVSLKAVQDARATGIKVGTIRLIVVWPFPEKLIRKLASKVKAFIVPEINLGQISLEVERCAQGKTKTIHVPHAGGWVHDPNDILKAIKKECKMSEITAPTTSTLKIPKSPEPLAHPMRDYLRTERLPHIWCSTCGIGTVLTAFIAGLQKSGLDRDKVAVVSGIGCSGRAAGYLRLDSFHSTHGRAIPFATGLALGNPELKVAVISGDGDIAAIGGNHFIHAARRNMNLTIICINNFNYAMTGGQAGPTTPLEANASTAPYGAYEFPFNLPYLAESCGAIYVARWTSLHVRRATKSIAEALVKPGFSFIEVIAPCPTLYARRNRLGTGLDLMRFYHDTAKIQHGANTKDIDIDYQKEIVVGKFVDKDKPDFFTNRNNFLKNKLGDKYIPYEGTNNGH